MKIKNNTLAWIDIHEFLIYEIFICGTFLFNNKKHLLLVIDFDQEEYENGDLESIEFAISIEFGYEINYANYLARKISALELLMLNDVCRFYCRTEYTSREKDNIAVSYSGWEYLCTLSVGAIPHDLLPTENSFLPTLWYEEDEHDIAEEYTMIFEKHEMLANMMDKIYKSDAFTIENAYRDFCTGGELKNGHV